MLQILGDKMDKLEEWGVLKKTEDIRVVPEFVVPSMLLPKPEKGEWRLVIDFTPFHTTSNLIYLIISTKEEVSGSILVIPRG